VLEFELFQEISTPEVLYEEVVEVDCRVVPALPGRCMLKEGSQWRCVTGTTGEELLVCRELNEDTLQKDLTILKEKGINSIAVVLAHSYTCV
jgi:5-oxoprolinase (ATP-hydrolysing)